MTAYPEDMRYVGILGACLLWSGCAPTPVGPVVRESVAFDLDQSEATRVELQMAAGELLVDGGSQRLAEAEFAYNVASWKPQATYHSTGSRSDLVIRQPDTSGVAGEFEYGWKVRLNDAVAMDVHAKLGAGSARLNLGSLTLRNVEVEIGAGEMDLDLRGHPRSSYDVRVRGGVGQAIVRLPRSVAIEATASGGIGEIDATGLVQRDGRWINPAAEHAAVKIRVDVKGGVGEIRLVAE